MPVCRRRTARRDGVGRRAERRLMTPGAPLWAVGSGSVAARPGLVGTAPRVGRALTPQARVSRLSQGPEFARSLLHVVGDNIRVIASESPPESDIPVREPYAPRRVCGWPIAVWKVLGGYTRQFVTDAAGTRILSEVPRTQPRDTCGCLIQGPFSESSGGGLLAFSRVCDTFGTPGLTWVWTVLPINWAIDPEVTTGSGGGDLNSSWAGESFRPSLSA